MKWNEKDSKKKICNNAKNTKVYKLFFLQISKENIGKLFALYKNNFNPCAWRKISSKTSSPEQKMIGKLN